MTVEHALKEAHKTIEHANSGYDDKIVLFYYVTPDNYLRWFLASKYSARHQLYETRPVRTCWNGNPAEQYFLEQILTQACELRNRMCAEVKNAIARFDFDNYVDMESHQAIDEIKPTDKLF